MYCEIACVFHVAKGFEFIRNLRLRKTHRVRASGIQRAKSVAEKVGLNSILRVGEKPSRKRRCSSSRMLHKFLEVQAPEILRILTICCRAQANRL